MFGKRAASIQPESEPPPPAMSEADLLRGVERCYQRAQSAMRQGMGGGEERYMQLVCVYQQALENLRRLKETAQ